LTSEYQNPVQALNLLFFLLASVEDGNLGTFSMEKWGITDMHIPNGFDAFIDRFRQGTGDIIPDLSLILRHSSGVLFQEAQKRSGFF